MTSTAKPARPGLSRRLAAALYRYPRLQLGLLLAPPLGALVIAYLASLLLLLINAFWRYDAFTGRVVTQPTLDNFVQIVTTNVFRDVAVRTILTAAAVTVADALIAFPIAYFMARVASRRTRNLLIVAVLLPLWSGYLVKVHACHRQHRLREHRGGGQHPAGSGVRLRPDPGHDRLPGARPAHGRVRVALMERSYAARLILRIATAATLLFIYLPIALIVVYAFNTNRVPTWPPAGFTLDWFGKAAQSSEIRDSLSLSIRAATGATL